MSHHRKSSLVLSVALYLAVLSAGLTGWQAQAFAAAKAKSNWSVNYKLGLAAQAAHTPAQAANYFRLALREMQSEPHQEADQELCMHKLGDALMLHGQPRQAQIIYSELLSKLQQRYGAQSHQAAAIMVVLGSLQESLGDHTAAMNYYKKALKINEKNFDAYSPEFASGAYEKSEINQGFAVGSGSSPKRSRSSLSSLAGESGLSASGEMPGLLKNYSDLIKDDNQSNRSLISDFNTDIYGKEKNGTVGSGSTVADNAASISNWQQQNAFKLKAHAQSQISEDPAVQLRGLDSQNLAPVYKTMSDTIFNESHFEKGEAYYQRKIAIDLNALGPAHPTVANDLCGLAVFYLSEQKYDDARPLLKRALPIYQKAWGENNILTINTEASLAGAEFHLGNIDVASNLYKQALSAGQSALGPNNIETARILNNLAYLYFHQGKLAEACTFYEWALASTESAVGQKDPLVAACLKDYAQVLKGLGRTAEAFAVESRADAILANAANAANAPQPSRL